MVLCSLVEGRLTVLRRILSVQNSNSKILTSSSCKLWTTAASSNCKNKASEDSPSGHITIGDVTKPLKKPANPELVPSRYLPKDEEIPHETLKHMKWIMQKDLLGQDIFLIGRPSPLRRQVAMQYLQLTEREVEYVALSRDTTESDLKQRREIIQGTAHYIDQSAVRAASQGRILILEGIEKAERNVLPVLNNLLENREMHLEDGRLLIPADRYDKLLKEYGRENLEKWQLVRVSEDFRVIALGLPVPHYLGNPLDPPLRSRFQARDIRQTPFGEQLKLLQTLGDRLPDESVNQLLSFAHTLVTDESHNLGLLDFPIENLPALVKMLNNAPNVPLYDAVNRLYPYKTFLPNEGSLSVEGTLQTFQVAKSGSVLSKIMHGAHNVVASPNSNLSQIQVKVGKKIHEIEMPVGHHFMKKEGMRTSYVETSYHESLMGELLLSHSVHDFCIIGPRGCGKTVIVERLAEILGYDLEPIMLYQDMTARDLLQQRTTLANGDTIWRFSPLVEAAIGGKLAVLDGIHRIHRGTLAVLHQLIHDRQLQLYDGTRLLGSERYEEARIKCGNLSDEEMTQRKILKIQDNFRIVALAEPPTVGGSAKGQWLTSEVLSMFLFHEMRALSKAEEYNVITNLTGKTGETIDQIMRLTQNLRTSEDASLSNIANSLSTRQLVRIAKRQHRFPDENVYEVVNKACLARFLPGLARDALEKVMLDIGIQKQDFEENYGKNNNAICQIQSNTLTIGKTSAPIYDPLNKTKIPETLFYNTEQNLNSLEAMLQDYLLGEHLLLIGNQGVGKNKLVDQLLNLLNRPREYIQLHRDTTVQSLTLQPTVKSGIIIYEDSPLVKAVKSGHILVVDEADKAPTHVTCILKTLVESGEMILSDGRRIVPPSGSAENISSEKLIQMHPDFRLMVLANRPGFPFLGNDFFAALGDLFSCHAVDNPSMDSELKMLKQYGPDVSDEILRRLVTTFSELRSMADEGTIQYPYSTREVVNIVKHLNKFPNEGLGQIVRNVFDFDAYDKEARESVEEVLHKHGIPLNSSKNNIRLAKEFPLPERRLLGTWEIRRNMGSTKKMMKLPIEETQIYFNDLQQVTQKQETLDRVEARGVGFSELQSYFSLPFHDFSIVGDVCTVKDKHNRPQYDTVHVVSTNPVWLYSMQPTSDKLTRILLNHYFDKSSRSSGSGGNWRSNVLPKMKIVPLGGRLNSLLAVHDEVSNNLILVDPATGGVISIDSNSNGWLKPLKDLAMNFSSNSKNGQRQEYFYRLRTDFASTSKLLFYTPRGNIVQLMDLSGDAPICNSVELPFKIESLHPLNEHQYLVSAYQVEDNTTSSKMFLLRKESDDESIPNLLNPIIQSYDSLESGQTNSVSAINKEGLSDFGLKFVLKESLSSPNTLCTTPDSYATLVMGFPELEFSPNEVYCWPKFEDSAKISESSRHTAYRDPSRNVIFLKDSCQIITPVSPKELPKNAKESNYGLSVPGNITAYLQVVDLMSSRLRYIPVPEPAQMSVYASWYKQSYPDQVLSLSAMSNDGLVSVDNAGTVRIWETGVANLEKSLADWRRMIGDLDNRDLMIKRDNVGDLDSPKHGKLDPNNAPHIGGNTWAGGTGGRDTAGLGGVGGPYRLDAGHDVHQVSDEAKAQVPEHIRQAAREMNRKAYQEKLREIKMSEFDANLYQEYAAPVRRQVTALKNIISGLQAKAKERQWLKNQTQGELDDTRLIEGITGEKTIYKKRGESDPEPGAVQEKPKRLRLLVDVSGSMYRFNGHDLRLDRMLESTLMVMEAFEDYNDKIVYDIVGHSGEENGLPFTRINKTPNNEKERLDVLKTMHAHSQFCMSGDHTLSATVLSINDLANRSEDFDESFVIILSDANFDRYGISPNNFAKILNRKSDQVNAFAIFIGSLGDQADRIAKRLPAGKAFVCLDTKKIPEILKTIFTSTMLK